ncbi:MAG: hypothetical protein WC086_02525, partial [Dehalococcoidales bacterium]
ANPSEILLLSIYILNDKTGRRISLRFSHPHMENYACVSYRDTKQTVIQAFRLSKMIDCAFFIHTPAQAHLWAQVMKKLIARGISAVAIIRGGYDISHLLEAYKLPSVTYGISAKTSHLKIIQLPGISLQPVHYLKLTNPQWLSEPAP